MFRAPSRAGLPSFKTLLDDLPASIDQVARHIDMTPATLKKYRNAEQAPRAVMLALFWESRWGRSSADCEAANFAAMHHRTAKALEHENEALKKQIFMLEKLLLDDNKRAANAPFFRIGS